MWFSLWNGFENVEWNWSDFGALYNPGSIQQGNKKAQKTQLLLTSCFWLRALSLTLSQVLSASVSSLCFWLGPLPGSFCLSVHTFTRLCHLLGPSWMLLLSFLTLPLSLSCLYFFLSPTPCSLFLRPCCYLSGLCSSEEPQLTHLLDSVPWYLMLKTTMYNSLQAWAQCHSGLLEPSSSHPNSCKNHLISSCVLPIVS